MSVQTTTSSMSVTRYFAVCGCCHHHDDMPLYPTIVTCGVCGAPCSCPGCVEEFGPDPLDRTLTLRDVFDALVPRMDGPRITPGEAIRVISEYVAAASEGSES